MHRVADALARYAPSDIAIVDDVKQADVQVLHTVGAWPSLPRSYAIIQYCYCSGGTANWKKVWADSKVVWSYYDLTAHGAGNNFYYAPLGVDLNVFFPRTVGEKDLSIVTTGYVSSPAQEAIEEVAEAALSLRQNVFHLGPRNIEGMAPRLERSWRAAVGISDDELALAYSRARWVSGLRHVEGFELPVLEGAACGAAPIVFDRPETRHWFGDFATFVPECEGKELVSRLREILSGDPPYPSVPWKRFDWQELVRGFWFKLLEEL